jgi:hypothetical protein
MLDVHGFYIKAQSVVCPQCNEVFATLDLAKMNKLTPDSQVETDLHRVLPDPLIRSTFIAVCPACLYAWWFAAFAPHYVVPDLVPESPTIEFPKKFALAVLSGRNNGAHALDRAMLPLNGCWCAREVHTKAGTSNTPEAVAENIKWLTLASQELEEALKDDNWDGNRNRYQYIMGEVQRQLGEFDKAIAYFQSVDRRSMLPRQLVTHQLQMAEAKLSNPDLLPPFLVEMIFLPKAQVIETLPEPQLADYQQPAQSADVLTPAPQSIPA